MKDNVYGWSLVAFYYRQLVAVVLELFYTFIEIMLFNYIIGYKQCNFKILLQFLVDLVTYGETDSSCMNVNNAMLTNKPQLHATRILFVAKNR